MDENFLFWHPVIIEYQLDFEGKEHKHEVLCEGHILYGGRLLCKESMEVLKNHCKNTPKAIVKDKTMKVRSKVKICPTCQDLYKKNLYSAWNAWVEGKPKTVSSQLPALNKF